MSNKDKAKEHVGYIGDPSDPSSLAFLRDVKLTVSVELDRKDLTVGKILALSRGSVIELDKLSEEPLDVRVNGTLVARGEAVIVNEKFGIRITQINSPEGEEII
ncbi:MAG: flagellar motor switch protein FliN [Candidatus Dadabacteria bacterium]|nr:MAG: flagellar motor switch protein FliN [Candidatus Dadabacteria bacterium]